MLTTTGSSSYFGREPLFVRELGLSCNSTTNILPHSGHMTSEMREIMIMIEVDY